jgi:hypothetical protein
LVETIYPAALVDAEVGWEVEHHLVGLGVHHCLISCGVAGYCFCVAGCSYAKLQQSAKQYKGGFPSLVNGNGNGNFSQNARL